jgi:hypothetical protein
MNDAVYEQTQAGKVKARLRMLEHAERVSGNVSQTRRFLGVSRSLYYIWKQRCDKKGTDGLRDLKRRPHHIRYRIPLEIVALVLRIREERRYGAVRTSLYLQRHYHAYVSPTTILKLFHRHHVGQISKKKYRPGPKAADAPLPVPDRSVQLDVKFVPRIGRARQRFYQFTAIDEATRFRVLRIYDHNNTKTARTALPPKHHRRFVNDREPREKCIRSRRVQETPEPQSDRVILSWSRIGQLLWLGLELNYGEAQGIRTRKLASHSGKHHEAHRVDVEYSPVLSLCVHSNAGPTWE